MAPSTDFSQASVRRWAMVSLPSLTGFGLTAITQLIEGYSTISGNSPAA